MRKITPLVLTAAASLLFLTGCTGGGAGNGDAAPSNQSVTDACTIAEEKVTAAQGDLNEAMSAAQEGDTEAVSTIIADFQAALDEAETEITNDEVAPIIGSLSDDFAAIGDALEEMAGLDLTDPANAEKLTTISESMQETSTSLQDSASQMQELCG